MPSITTEDILDAIRRAERPDDSDGFTTRELGEMMGLKDRVAVYARLRRALEAGVLEPVRVRRQLLTGTWQWTTGYRLTGR